MKVRKETIYFADLQPHGEFGLKFEPIGEAKYKREGGSITVSYLTLDNYPSNPLSDAEGCMGSILTKANDSKAFYKAIGSDEGYGRDLQKVFEDNLDEVAIRYVKKVLVKESELNEMYGDCVGGDGSNGTDLVKEDLEETYASILKYDVFNSQSWDCVDFEDEMNEALLEMYSDPKYFPGEKYFVPLRVRNTEYAIATIVKGAVACWIPDSACVEHLKTLEGDFDENLKKECRSVLDVFNAYISGDVYCVVTQVLDIESGSNIETEIIGGFYGIKHAEEGLADIFGEATNELPAPPSLIELKDTNKPNKGLDFVNEDLAF
jgi:hypothetical protein